MSEWPNEWVDPVRWFDRHPRCRECNGVAVGVLRGPQNESHGSYCERHGEKRLKAAKKAQDRPRQNDTEKKTSSHLLPPSTSNPEGK